MGRRIEHDPQRFFRLRRYAERTAMRWTPCPVMAALALEADADVSASRRAHREADRRHAEESRRSFNAAWSD